MEKFNFAGTGVALVTPFHDDSHKAVDYPALARLIDHTIAGGVSFLVSLGTTGETPTLTHDEQDAVLAFTLQHVAKRVPLVAGFGGNDTAKLVSAIKHFDFTGFAGILSASPSYNRPTQEGIFRHYMALAEATPVPMLLYNVPARTGSNIAAETTMRLATEAALRGAPIAGIKEASCNLAQCAHLAKHKPEHFVLLSGDDNFTLALLAHGGEGLISVSANAFPYEVSTMVRHALDGDFVTARTLHHALQDLTDLLFAEGNPAGIKAALELREVCSASVRLPLVEASGELRNNLQREIVALRNTMLAAHHD